MVLLLEEMKQIWVSLRLFNLRIFSKMSSGLTKSAVTSSSSCFVMDKSMEIASTSMVNTIIRNRELRRDARAQDAKLMTRQKWETSTKRTIRVAATLKEKRSNWYLKKIQLFLTKNMAQKTVRITERSRTVTKTRKMTVLGNSMIFLTVFKSVPYLKMIRTPTIINLLRV